MGDDYAQDPSAGPYDLPGPDVGASVTFDSSGHPTQIGIDVPGTAQGSDQATIDLGGHHDAAPQDPGWMPHISQDPPLTFMDMPPPEGFHWDPITHVAVPNLYQDMSFGGDASQHDTSGYGDYPEPSGDDAPA
jgi:hypothetical protein